MMQKLSHFGVWVANGGLIECDLSFREAQLETLNSYVVDFWHLDNGKPPYIQALNDWLRKRPFQQRFGNGGDVD
jgi:hypothetical protein